MPAKAERDLTRIGLLDYVLMSIGSCLAVYSAGMSIQQPSISYFCVLTVIVGAGISYLIRGLTINSVFIKFDALFYSLAVIGAIFFSGELRGIMPEGGFPREIAAAGWLSWMLMLGSFATWQDSTLLFQAIPALALFGLIGCYDTFRAVTLAFFAFLICLATLFARAHGREMLQKAAESGYFTRGLAPGAPIPSVETTPGLALKLKKGPWRWIAGPEWALASAMAVVLVSLLGAPVIRESVSSVAGFVKLTPPPVRAAATAAAQAGTADVGGQSVRIGRPFSRTVSRPILKLNASGIAYLKTEQYDKYTGHGWQNTITTTDSNLPIESPLNNMGQWKVKDPEKLDFKIHMLRTLRLLPLPANTQQVSTNNGSLDLKLDGTWEQANSTTSDNVLTGYAIAPPKTARPTSVTHEIQWGTFIDRSLVPERVQQLAQQVTSDKVTAYEKAVAIRTAIEKRIVYNLDAAETPSERDPVEYSLFDLKQGYCTAFASAMVVMARTVGLPARYVQGYMTGDRERQPDGGYIVTDADYHAWAELYFDNVGWVVFDPTLNAAAVPGEGIGEMGDNRPWYQKGFLPIAIDALIVLTIVGLIASVVRSTRNVKRTGNFRSELDKTFVVFNRAMERAVGRRRSVGQTANEFVDSIQAELGASYLPAKALTARFVKEMYSADVVKPETVEQLKLDLKPFSRSLKVDARKVEKSDS